MSELKLLLIVIGSRPSPSLHPASSISVQELTLATSRSPLEISHTPFLDCLAASGANGLLECDDMDKCMELLGAFAASYSSSNDSWKDGPMVYNEAQQIAHAMNDVTRDQGSRVSIVHLRPHSGPDPVLGGSLQEADGSSCLFATYVDALGKEVACLEQIDRALFSALHLLAKAENERQCEEGPAENLLIGLIYMGPMISSTPYMSIVEPEPICLAKADCLIRSLGGAEALKVRADTLQRKPKAKRPAPSSPSLSLSLSLFICCYDLTRRYCQEASDRASRQIFIQRCKAEGFESREAICPRIAKRGLWAIR